MLFTFRKNISVQEHFGKLQQGAGLLKNNSFFFNISCSTETGSKSQTITSLSETSEKMSTYTETR